jgi:hypothetical protein
MPEVTPQGVDAGAVSAVAARIRDILAEDGTVVSIPTLTTGYTADALRFAESGASTVQQSRTAAEFAELVNRVPVTGPGWSWDGVEHLWDIYRDVLAAELATSTRTPPEQKRYAAAQKLLYREAGGARVPSPVYLAYQSCGHAVVAAQTALAESKGSAKEAALTAALHQAEQDWLVKGHRKEVDAALLDLDSLGDKDPAQTWIAYRRQFEPEPGSANWATSPDGSQYAVTGFSPAGILGEPWAVLRIDRSELPDTAAGIESVSFEYCLVRVVRPWLDPAMLRSRAWRFAKDAPDLCDGADPPSGRCTSYVESVVFARSLSVVRGSAQGDEAACGEGEPMGLGFLEPQTALLIPSETATLEGNEIPADFTPTEETERVMGHFVFPGTPPPEEALSADTPDTADTPAPDGETVTTSSGTVLVVAFILRLLPKCPDPNPDLTWVDETAPTEIHLPRVQYGATNEEVRTLQNALITRGRNIPSGATGHFGNETKAAYAAEQLAQGYTGHDADGVPGCKSLTTLGELAGFTVQC